MDKSCETKDTFAAYCVLIGQAGSEYISFETLMRLGEMARGYYFDTTGKDGGARTNEN